MTKPLNILVADWGLSVIKRVTYLVKPEDRSIERVAPPDGGWTVQSLADYAYGLKGPVLVLVDVAIGLPIGLFNAWGNLGVLPQNNNLIQFLHVNCNELDDWLGDVNTPNLWRLQTPYIRVPSGNGALTGFRNAAANVGVDLKRAIDAVTQGRSPLILSGIPGTVGSGSRDFIRSIGGLDGNTTAFWPFDGNLAELLNSKKKVIFGEIYPRALYGQVLLDGLSGDRGFLTVAKTKPQIRDQALASLQALNWHRDLNIQLTNELIEQARDNEDDFNAFFSSLGILRLLTEGVSLEDTNLRNPDEQGRPLIDPIAEGGMLGVLSTQIDNGIGDWGQGGANPGPGGFNGSPKGPNYKAPKSSGEKLKKGGRGSEVTNGGDQTGPAVRVTQRVIDQGIRDETYQGPISFRGLPGGTRNDQIWIRIVCQGRQYTLTVGDTYCIWPAHQVATVEDFDDLYHQLSQTPDVFVPVQLISVQTVNLEDLEDDNDV